MLSGVIGMKILVVDDEILIRDVIKEYLLIEGYDVDEAVDGDDAVSKCRINNYSLIIMDVMMPNKDGFQACREIKAISDVPFIMLSARSEEYDKLIGFDLGIDDYVTKPFSPKELVARVKAVLKRSVGEISVIKIDSLKINDKAHEVTIDDKAVYLTPKEYDLLKCFVLNKNVALSREQLITNVWGYDFYGDDRTIDTHIKTLRKNLGIYGDRIKTVRGIGYKFEYNEE
jgi:DNA-binding response OmpR family regulator